MSKYMDVNIALILFFIGILMVVVPVLYGFLYPHPLYIFPIDRAKIIERLLMTEEAQTHMKDNGYDFVDNESSQNNKKYQRIKRQGDNISELPVSMSDVTVPLIKKHPKSKDFLAAIGYLDISKLTTYSFYHLTYDDMDRNPIFFAALKLLVYHIINKDVDVSAIKKYVYKKYKDANLEKLEGNFYDLNRFFKDEYNAFISA